MKVEGNCYLQFGYLLDVFLGKIKVCIGPKCTFTLKLIPVLVALSNKEYFYSSQGCNAGPLTL